MPPRFSVVTPVYDPPEHVLRDMLRSVAEQTNGDWEHCLVDDASPAPHVQQVLREAAAADPRVRIVRRAANGGIVPASNDGLAMATGEFVVLLDHDDELRSDALELIGQALDATPEADYLYSDEDKIDEAGRLSGTNMVSRTWSARTNGADGLASQRSLARKTPTTSSTSGSAGIDTGAPLARNGGTQSTRWRTTSRATHPSHGDGLAHASSGTERTRSVKAAATLR